MTAPLVLHPDRLFPAEPKERAIARELYAEIADLPLLCPHGHTDPQWFADDQPFENPTALLITPDHYLIRMLYSQGIPPEQLGVRPVDTTCSSPVAGPRQAWRTFAACFHLFRGTPSGLWFNHALREVFGIEHRLTADTADASYDRIADCLTDPAFRPRALLDRFGIDVIATTDSALSSLRHHQQLAGDGFGGRIIPTFRPDTVVDPAHERFADGVQRLGELTGRDTTSWDEYLAALFDRRQLAISLGATASDHGHPSASTASLDQADAAARFQQALSGRLDPAGQELLRGHLLVEMAAMSLDDGLVMQLHAGSRRNHNRALYQRFGRDIGGDIPGPIDYVEGLRALLNRFGNDAGFRLVVFTLDESTFSRELAPLAGHYPAMFLGPPWWFLDSVDGMLRYRRLVTDTAGFANTSGFVDDTRAFLSIPARHDVARRVDCRHLAELVSDHRLELDEARELARDLTVGLPRRVYNLEQGAVADAAR